jgi:hypothetical protein
MDGLRIHSLRMEVNVLNVILLIRESEAGHCPSFWLQGPVSQAIRAEDIVMWGV